MDYYLQTKSWEEAETFIQSSKGVAILPIGSVEQHGPHLPLGTDSYVAITLAEDAAEKTGAIVIPPIWFGWSPHHMVLPGTVTIRPEVLIDLTYDVVTSLAAHGIDKVILLNGHRIVNTVWMQLAAEKIQKNTTSKVKIFDPAYMSKDIVKQLHFGAVGHAEEIETSHMMYRYPELVHIEKALDHPITRKELYSVDPGYENDTLCYVPSTMEEAEKNAKIAKGTGGEPSKADSEKGKVYHTHLVGNLIKVIQSLQNTDTGR